jgi:hypothetical protein
MPRSPSTVPEDSGRDVFGPLGRAWREMFEADTDRTTLIRDLLDGQTASMKAQCR